MTDAMVFSGADGAEIEPLVKKFHYSRRMPSNIQRCYSLRLAGGLFGHTGEVIAGVIFSIPPTRWSEEVLELSRLVRRPDCVWPLTKLIAEACFWLKKSDHHLAVSFADWTQRHHGGVYQAAGWNYAGMRERAMDGVLIDGVFKPGRSCNSTWGTRSPEKLALMLPGRVILPHYDEGKHLYWRALTVAGKTRARRLDLQSLAYPKPDNAARPLDEPVPTGASQAQPLGAAP